LGSVKESEEEDCAKESKRIYSLHDLSKDLRRLQCRSDLFEGKEISLGKISLPQNDVNSGGIKESDSEYEESSGDDKSAASETRIGRTVVLDKAEPLEENLEKALRGVRNKNIPIVPDTIEEEAGDSDPLADNPKCMINEFFHEFLDNNHYNST